MNDIKWSINASRIASLSAIQMIGTSFLVHTTFCIGCVVLEWFFLFQKKIQNQQTVGIQVCNFKPLNCIQIICLNFEKSHSILQTENYCCLNKPTLMAYCALQSFSLIFSSNLQIIHFWKLQFWTTLKDMNDSEVLTFFSSLEKITVDTIKHWTQNF